MQHAIILQWKKKKKKTITRVNNWLLAHLKFPRIITTDQLDDSAACLTAERARWRRIISTHTQSFEEIFDARRIENRFFKFWWRKKRGLSARNALSSPSLRNNPKEKKRKRSQLEKYKVLERTSCLRGQVQGSSVKNRGPSSTGQYRSRATRVIVSRSIRPPW